MYWLNHFLNTVKPKTAGIHEGGVPLQPSQNMPAAKSFFIYK